MALDRIKRKKTPRISKRFCVLVRQRASNWIYNILFLFYKIFINYQDTPKHTPILSKSKFFRGVLWHFCQAVKYGLIVTPAITRRLVGWCLPYSSSRLILPLGGFCLYRLCRSCAQTKKAYIDKKVVVTVVTVVTGLSKPYKSGLSW